MSIHQRPKQLIRRFAITLCCIWVICGTLLAQSPMAGGDPFGGTDQVGAPDDAFGVAPTARKPAAREASLPVDDPDPVVRLLRSQVPKTPSQMADGLTWTLRLKRWDEIGRLLDRMQLLGWTVEQKAEVARQMGAATILRLRSSESTLSDAQKAVAAELFQAPATLSHDPKWIDQWIEKLASIEPADRLAAQLRLHDAGMSAVARLANRLLAGDPRVPAVQLAMAACSFGDDGKEALRSACLVRDIEAAARVQVALAQLPGSDFGSELGAALVSRTMPAVSQQELANSLAKKYASLPSAQAIESHLNARFDAALKTYQTQRSLQVELTDFVWRPTAGGSTIERVEVPQSEKALEAVARLAAQRTQLQSATSDGLAISAAVLLQRAYKMRAKLYAGEMQYQMLAEIAPEVREDFAWWQQVFAQCQTLQLHGGALRALQMMPDATRKHEFDAALSFLTKLLKDSSPAIRYSALEALEQLDPKSTYYGNEWAMETAIEMSRLQTGPHALVIGLQSELRQAAQQQINQQTGSDVTVVNSGVAALKVLDEPIPVELILIVDRVADQSISQLIQRLRRCERGRALPIAVLTEQLYGFERDLISETSGVVASVLSRNPEQMQRVLAQMDACRDTAPMSSTDRENFSASANRFLARIASDRQQYAFYPFSKWHSAIIDNSHQVTAASRVAMLSGLGSAESQSKLVALTVESSSNEQKKLEAAKAFARSVRQFGMNMRRDDVSGAYDLYNEVGPKDPVAMKAMGLVLDVIEAQAGKAPWPEGL